MRVAQVDEWVQVAVVGALDPVGITQFKGMVILKRMRQDQRGYKGIIGRNADFGHINVDDPGVGVFNAYTGFYIQKMEKRKRTSKIYCIYVPFVI